MKTIKLTKNKYALVDDKDFYFLSKFKWCSSHGYAVTRIIGGRGEQLRMHTENIINSKMRIDNTSGYKGITWDKNRGKYFVQISAKKKHYNIGRFVSIGDAVTAYNKASMLHHGLFARTNKTTL